MGRAFEARRVPRIKWEALRVETVAERFSEAAEQKMRGMGQGREDSTRWSEIAQNLIETARDVCGEQGGSVENEWLVNKEEEDQGLRHDITAAEE